MAYYYVSKGETSTGIILNDPDQLYVLDGGVANETTVNEYSIMEVSSGGTANNTTISSSGFVYVSSGGVANSTFVTSYGTFIVSSGGTANNTTGRLVTVLSGGTVNSTTVYALIISSGATANDTSVGVGNACNMHIYSGGTTYSQVKVKDITLKAGKESAALNNLRLAAGDYYIKVETSSVKKSTGYEVQVTHSDFYTDGDGGWNNALLNKKALVENAQYFYDNKLSVSGAIHLDKSGDYKKNTAAQYIYEGEKYGGFVCFGDETDFAKLTLSGTTKLTFSLSATNDATLEIFKVTQSGAKYSKKSLKTAKYKAGSEDAATAKVHLEVKDGVSYYVSVKATNVKKTTVDPRTYYNVSYEVVPKDACALAMQETSDALAMTDSLSFGQYASADALANASASSLADLDGISARQEFALLA